MCFSVPDTRYAAVADFDAVKPDRIGMHDLRDDGAHHACMRDDQTVSALIACDYFMVSRTDAENEVIERFRTLWPIMYRIIHKALIFAGAVDFDFIVAQTFPGAETNLLKPWFDADIDLMFFAECSSKGMATL